MELYDRLGIVKGASKDEIKKAYKAMISKNHPDKGGDPDEAAQINLAYDILSDENKRLRYDRGEATSTAPINEMHEVNNLFISIFTAVVSANMDNIDTYDIFKGINGTAQGKIRAADANIKHKLRLKTNNQKLMDKISCKGDSNSIIHVQLSRNINELDNAIANEELVISRHKAVIDLVSDYKYEFNEHTEKPSNLDTVRSPYWQERKYNNTIFTGDHEALKYFNDLFK